MKSHQTTFKMDKCFVLFVLLLVPYSTMSQDYVVNLTSEGTIVNITSPNFPNDYGNNVDIEWQVIAPTDFRVKIQFNDFKLGSGDSLSVYHGLTNSLEDATRSAHLSDSLLPDNISSIGSYLWLRFKSDSAMTMKGFSLMVIAVETVIINLTSEGTTVNITSPNFPNNYDNNDDISWQVVAPTGFRVKIQFNDFELVPGDSLSVYHGLTNSLEDATIRAFLSGTSLPGNLAFIGSYLWLWFKTDSTGRNNGFSLMVSAIEPVIINLTSEERTMNITSPNYPNNYVKNVDILWQVISLTDFRVMVQFNDFKLEPGDLLIIYHGLTNSLEDATQRALLLGSSLPDNISSIGSYLWLWFISDGSETEKGFSLSIRAVEPASSSTIIMNTTPLQTTTLDSTQSEVSSEGPTPVGTSTSLVPIISSTLASLSAIAFIVLIVCLVCRQKRLKHGSSQGIAASGEPRESPGIKDNPTFDPSSVHDLQMVDVADCSGGNDPYMDLTTPHDGPTVHEYQTLGQVISHGDGYEVPINGANGRTGPEYDKTLHKFQIHPETDYEITHEYQDITNNVVARNNLNNESPVCGLQEHPETDYGITHEYQDPGIVGTNIPQYESQVQPETDYEAIHEYEEPSIIGKSIPQYESHIIGPTM